MTKTIAASRIWMIASLCLFTALIVYIILYPPGRTGEASVAKVNGVSISKTQLYDAMAATGGSQTLDGLINEELVRQEAEKTGIQVTDADLDKEMESIKKTFPSEEEFQNALKNYGMTLESLKEKMQVQVKIRKLLEPQVTVSDDDIKKYYDTNLESLKIPEQVRASHILVATKEEAEAILSDLKNGGDFAAIAKDKSLDPGSKEKGGDLDFFPRGVMEEPFEAAAFALKAGDLSQVVQTSHGFHVIKQTDHKEASTPTLEEKKDTIRESIVNEQISMLSSSWLEEKKSAASIETTL